MSLHTSTAAETAGYIYHEVLRNTRYLVLAVDARGTVTEQDCPGAAWEVEGLAVGKRLPDALRAIVLSTPIEQRTQLYPYIYLSDSLIVDVHVLSRDGQRQLILQDVSEAHDAELKLQQKAHEVSLLLEKQAELNCELELRRAEAERASQAKSRFIASMSHEFRTPITSIMGHAELLARQTSDQKLPGAIQRASWHLLTLVENLLEQARQGEGIVQLNPGPVDLGVLLQDMRDLFFLQAESRGLELRVSGPDAQVNFEADELRLRQVLINLLSNALRYTDAGRVRLAVGQHESGLAFSVADTGPGIGPADRERIFQPFERLEPDREAGAGLGLSVSRQLVRAMGGELNLASEPGSGSTFSFTLPIATAADAVPAAVLEGTTALLVDDDADVLDLYHIMLTDWGMRVHTASGFRQALEAAGRQDFDVVITDLHLGDGSGAELLARIGEMHRACRRFLLTGSGSVQAAHGSAACVADAILFKPVRPEHLKSALSRAVAGRD